MAFCVKFKDLEKNKVNQKIDDTKAFHYFDGESMRRVEGSKAIELLKEGVTPLSEKDFDENIKNFTAIKSYYLNNEYSKIPIDDLIKMPSLFKDYLNKLKTDYNERIGETKQEIEQEQEISNEAELEQKVEETEKVYPQDKHDKDFLHQETTTIPQSNEAIVNNLKTYLKENYPEFKTQVIDDLIARENGIDFLGDVANNIISLKDGNEIVMSEEFSHIVIELHPEKKLFTDLVGDTKLYADVFSIYKTLLLYQNENGTPNIDKIKSEAAAKLLTEAIYSQTTGDWSRFNEWTTPNTKEGIIARLKQAIKKFFGFVKTLDYNVFKNTAQLIKNNEKVARVDTFQNFRFLQVDEASLNNNKLYESALDYMTELSKEDESYDTSTHDIITQIQKAAKLVSKSFSASSAKELDIRGNLSISKGNAERAADLHKIDKEDKLRSIMNIAKDFLNTMGSVQNAVTRYSAGLSKLEQLIPDETKRFKVHGEILNFTDDWSSFVQNVLDKINEIGDKGEFYNTMNTLKGRINLLKTNVEKELGKYITPNLGKEISQASETIRNENKTALLKNVKGIDDKILNNNTKSVLDYFMEYEGDSDELVNRIIKANKDENLTNKLDIAIKDLKLNVWDRQKVRSIAENLYNDKRILEMLTSKNERQNKFGILGRIFIPVSAQSNVVKVAFQKMIDTFKLQAQDLSADIIIPLYNKINFLRPQTKLSEEKVGEAITEKATVYKQGQKVDSYVYLMPLKEGSYTDLEDRKRELNAMTHGTTEYYEKLRQLEIFHTENFEREFKPEYYIAEYGDPIIIKAQEAERNILNQIKDYKTQQREEPYLIKGKWNADRQELSDKIKEEQTRLDELSSSYVVKNDNSKVEKTGDDLAIAKFFQRKNDPEGFWMNREHKGAIAGSFNNFLREVLSKGKYYESNKAAILEIQGLVNKNEYKSAYLKAVQLNNLNLIKWFKENMDIKYSILSKVEEIELAKNIDKLLKSEYEKLGIKSTYEEVQKLIQSKRTDLNIINGIEFNNEDSKKIKQLEELEKPKQVLSYLKQLGIPTELTEYYKKALLQYLDEDTVNSIIKGELEMLPSLRNIANNGFTEWFNSNHIEKDGIYDPISIWKQVERTNGNMEVAANMQHKSREIKSEFRNDSEKDIFGRLKAREYKLDMNNYFDKNGKSSEIKTEFKNPNVGLPSNVQTGYRNEKYYELKNNNPSAFGILDAIVTATAKEKLLNKYNDYAVIPQQHKEGIFEHGLLGTIKNTIIPNESDRNFSQKTEVLEKKTAREAFLHFVDSFSSKPTNSNDKDEAGNKIVKTSLEFYSHIDIKDLSRNVIKTSIDFLEASKLHQVLEDNVNFFSTGERIAGSMKDQIGKMIDMEFQGVRKQYEIGLFLDKVFTTGKKLGALSSTSIFNPKGAIKNMLSGEIMTWIHKNNLDYGSTVTATKKFYSKWSKLQLQLLNKTPKDLNFAIYQAFLPNTRGNFKYYAEDPLRKKMTNINELQGSLMEEGEFQVYGTMLELFLMKPITINDEKRKLGEVLKGEQKDGYMKVYIEGGTPKMLHDLNLEFAQIMRMNQGNTGRQKAQTDVGITTLGSALLFFRNHLPLQIQGKVGDVRTDIYLNKEVSGDYRTMAQQLYNFIQENKNPKEFWAQLTPYQRGQLIVNAKEVITIAAALTLLAAFGYQDGDRDKFKKLKENSWATNILIYEILATYNEVLSLSPYRPLDIVHESINSIKDTTLSLRPIQLSYKILEDVLLAMVGSDNAVNTTNKPFFAGQKGDLKVVGDILKLTGIQNLQAFGDNEALQYQIRTFVSSQNR